MFREFVASSPDRRATNQRDQEASCGKNQREGGNFNGEGNAQDYRPEEASRSQM
jgi:hypothetical protein